MASRGFPQIDYIVKRLQHNAGCRPTRSLVQSSSSIGPNPVHPEKSSANLIAAERYRSLTSPQVNAAAFIARRANKESPIFSSCVFGQYTLYIMSVSGPLTIYSLVFHIIPLLVRIYLNLVVNLWSQLCYIHSYC